jgi:hypothetical protein
MGIEVVQFPVSKDEFPVFLQNRELCPTLRNAMKLERK